jgi:hypothetical protein
MSKLDEMLSSASRSTVAELFSLDPFKLTKHDIDTMIEYYAEKRKDFSLTGKGSAVKPKASLADLGLM